MARDYHNLPALLDAFEDEMDLEAGALAKNARVAQTRGLEAVKRGHEAVAKKLATVQRIHDFADAMEATNRSNHAGDQAETKAAVDANPTTGSAALPGSSTASVADTGAEAVAVGASSESEGGAKNWSDLHPSARVQNIP